MKNSRLPLLIIVIAIVFAGYFLLAPSSVVPVVNAHATVYRSPSCGCCGNYVAYLKRNGVEVEDILTEDMDSIKDELAIPEEISSCHTTMIDGYFFEGHIPLEAVTEVIDGKPEISGIALPGMPSGAPGMPGAKMGAFMVHMIDNDGNTSVFSEI